MSDRIQWGLLAAGNIARAFADGVMHSKRGALLAVGSRSREKADTFGKQFGIPRCYGSYEALLADPDIDAVYISTPHPMHAEWAIKTAEAGKHILCEKPMTLNHAEAMAVIEAVQRHDVFFMEAFMYRCHPQTARLVELVREGAIGEIGSIRATFGFRTRFNAESRLWSNDLGGGGILDVGCYPVSMSRLVAGAALGQELAEPLEVTGTAVLHPESGADSIATASLKFPGGILAQLSTSVGLNQDNKVILFGSEGVITVLSPWVPPREGGTTIIRVERHGEEPRDEAIETDQWLYGMEADRVAAHIAQRQAPSPAMTHADSLGNMQVLDRWRAAVGLTYDREKPQRLTTTVANRPLVKRYADDMRYGRIAGLDKEISRVVVGLDNTPDMRHWCVMLDDFFERGGNCVDTAYIYGAGCYERFIGHWVRTRGVRDDMVIIDKGAHTPHCDPDSLTRELLESLDRLGLDGIDIYFMHRDNPDIPVGEFVDVLNEHKNAGRITVFGGSNWSTERIEAANAYAADKGLTGFGAISNNFSLARMIKAVWDGCIAASEPDQHAWFKKTQMPLFPWSSQARGFFVRGEPDFLDDRSLAECWYSEHNFKRQARARELAREKGVSPLNIALAYVLCQPFPTFPLIGPRLVSETRTALPALELELTQNELDWLNLARGEV